MKEQPTPNLIDQLFAEIERAWTDQGDRTIVYRLADQHPELRDELYEFYEDLVLGPSPEGASAFRDADIRIANWLRTTGLEIARAAAREMHNGETGTATTPSPTGVDEQARQADGASPSPGATGPKKDEPWLAFLKRRTGQSLLGLARGIASATPEYVVLVSRHPQLVPEAVRRELARQVEARWGVSAEDSLTCLASQPHLTRAASRQGPFDREPTTFDELLDRAAMTPAQRQAWRRHGD